MRTSGNTVLVTGGGSGIGLALTEALVRSGNEVIICGRRRNRLKAAQARLPGIHFRVCDLSNTRSRETLTDWVLSEFKHLNVLVNNAGIQRQVNFLKGSRDLAAAEEEVSTNLMAPIRLSARLLPHLMANWTATQHTSEISRDWYGSYAGVVPCADCAGIETSIPLNEDLSYQLRTRYLGKDDSSTCTSRNLSSGKQLEMSAI